MPRGLDFTIKFYFKVSLLLHLLLAFYISLISLLNVASICLSSGSQLDITRTTALTSSVVQCILFLDASLCTSSACSASSILLVGSFAPKILSKVIVVR